MGHAWMVRPPSGGAWLPLCPFRASSWMVPAISNVLAPNVYPFLSPFLPFLDGVSAFLTVWTLIVTLFDSLCTLLGWCARFLEGLGSPCAPGWCVCLLDGLRFPLCPCLTPFVPQTVSVLLRVLLAFLHCSPWCWMLCPPSRQSIAYLVGWCVCLPGGLDSHCTPHWMVRAPSSASWLALHPFLDGASVSQKGSSFVGWRFHLPEGLTSSFLPFYPGLFPFVGWCIRLPDNLVSLSSHCAPSCFPLLDGVLAFPRVLSFFVSHCAPSGFPLLDGVRARSQGYCLPVSPIIPRPISFCWVVYPPS